MTFAETIGSIGVALLLVAFVLNLRNVLDRTSRVYQGLNGVGAGLACYASYLIGFFPFVVLEGAWCLAAVVALARTWAERKETTPARIALAWLLAQGPSFVPIPGTTNMAHLRDNLGGVGVSFIDEELAELTASLDAIEVRGNRAPDVVAAWSYVEAPPAG